MLIVFGTIYMNLNMTVKRFPTDRETALSSTYTMLPAGKGANQALSAVRAGASKVALVGHVGDDGPGLRILANLKRNGVMTSGVAKSVDYPTGISTTVNDKAGGRQTYLALGANSLVQADQAPHDVFRQGNVLLAQLELPLEQTAIVMKAAHDKGAKVVLQASPMQAVPLPVLYLSDYLIINQVRVLQFAKNIGLEGTDIIKVMRALSKKAKLTCVAYKSDGSCLLVTADGHGFRFSTKTPQRVIDPYGAEDCFCGTFTACIHQGESDIQALHMAATAYALACVQKSDAEERFPYFDDIQQEMKTYGIVEPI